MRRYVVLGLMVVIACAVAVGGVTVLGSQGQAQAASQGSGPELAGLARVSGAVTASSNSSPENFASSQPRSDQDE